MMQTANFSLPPPPIPNLSVPPPVIPHHFQYRFHSDRGGGHRHFFQPFRPYPRPPPGGITDAEFDGKRLRKSVMRKTVDYNSAIIKMLENRVYERDYRDRHALQPDVLYYPDLLPPPSYIDNPINSVTTKFVKTATNKMRCPIFCMAWTPEGRRLVTGASSGEFTLWNGLTFNFETILQAHDSPVRTMVWSHNDIWMVTGDHAGYVKYWQSNMNNVKMFQAHKEAIRGLSFSPSDHKFVTCSDDGTLRIWDFLRCHEERILRGHGADVKCVHWHPQKGLIISGSKDNQQPVKLWDPKSGQSLATLHAHKSTVMDIKWNNNGNWVVTASRDHLLKLFDLRNLTQEVQTFRGHKKEASSIAWHPYHEGLFASGGSDGAILFWHVGADKEVGGIEQAHDSIVWTLAWHPLGHILCSGSNDHTSKFWTRNRPGDLMTDKYNLNTLPAGLANIDDQDIDEPAVIPGMGPEDKIEIPENITLVSSSVTEPSAIPGLDITETPEDKQKALQKKVPYSKPIPKNFQAQWNETGQSAGDEDQDESQGESRPKDSTLTEVITHLIESNPPPGVVPLSELKPEAVIVYGKIVPIEGNPLLAEAVAAGPEVLNRLIHSGQLDELDEVIPYIDKRSKKELEEQNLSEKLKNIVLPQPLPSSIFSHNAPFPNQSRYNDSIDFPSEDSNQTSLSGNYADKDMRTMMMKQFPKPNTVPDQDMRFSVGDVDLRHPPPFPATDQNYSEGKELRRDDIDFRQIKPSNSMAFNIFRKDEDFRNHQFGNPQYDDHDYRHFPDEDLRTELNVSGQQNTPALMDQDLRLNPLSNFSKTSLLGPTPGSIKSTLNLNSFKPLSSQGDTDIRSSNFNSGFNERLGLSGIGSLLQPPKMGSLLQPPLQFKSAVRPSLLNPPKHSDLRDNWGDNSFSDPDASNDSSGHLPRNISRTAPNESIVDKGLHNRQGSSTLNFGSDNYNFNNSPGDFDARKFGTSRSNFQPSHSFKNSRNFSDDIHERSYDYDDEEDVERDPFNPDDEEDNMEEDMYGSKWDRPDYRNEQYSPIDRSREYERGRSFRRGDNVRGSSRGSARGTPRGRFRGGRSGGRSRGRGVNKNFN